MLRCKNRLPTVSQEFLTRNDPKVRKQSCGQCRPKVRGRFAFFFPLPEILQFKGGEAFLLTVGAFLLTVKLLCSQSLSSQSLKALLRCTFPL